MPFGYARDSIADLQSLAHADEEGNLPDVDTSAAPSSAFIESESTTPDQYDYDQEYNDMLLMEDEQEAPLSIAPGMPAGKTLVAAVVPVVTKTVTPPHPPPAAFISTSTSIPLQTKMQQQSTLVVENSPSRMSNPSGRNRTGKKIRRSTSVSMKKQTAVYSGFDYSSDYYADSYSNALTTTKKDKKNILCCLFPFLEDPLLSDDDYGSDDDDDTKDIDNDSNLSIVSSSDVDNDSQLSIASSSSKDDLDLKKENGLTNVNVAVEKAQVEEFLPSLTASASAEDASSTVVSSAVLQPTSPAKSPTKGDAEPSMTPPAAAAITFTVTTAAKIANRGLEIEPEPEATIEPPPTPTPTIKGILKRTVIKPIVPSKSDRVLSTIPNSSSHDKDSNNGLRRRTILPTYEMASHKSQPLDDSVHAPQPKAVSFSSMARVMPVLPRSEMSYFTKSTIWWQRNDYDDFKKTGRIIAKAMVQGGSEIWLQTSDAWGKSQGKRSSAAAHKGNKGLQDSAEYKSALKKFGVEEDNEEKSIDDDDDDMGSKWWCKFGHSRRGLEHIVSVNEGRQRQKLVNASVSAVLEEQRRQRISRRDCNNCRILLG